MMQIAGDDLLRFNQVLNANVIDTLTYLTYMKQKGEIELFLRDIK